MTWKVLGGGNINIEWTDVYGRSGPGATVGIRGRVTAKGFNPGAATLLLPEVWATAMSGGHDLCLGWARPIPIVLGYAPPALGYGSEVPADVTPVQCEALVTLDIAFLEDLESRRAGGDIQLRIDTNLLLVNTGFPPDAKAVHFQVHPESRDQGYLQVKRGDWGSVLQQWNRGVGIPLVVALPESQVHPDRADIARFLKEAWRKIDGGDYQGAFVEARKSAELLRKISPAGAPIAKEVKDRDFGQRLHMAIQALFDMASAEPHADGATRNFVPTRQDAVALVGMLAAITQSIFAWMKE